MARTVRSVPREHYKFSLDPLHPFERDLAAALKEATDKERLHFGEGVEESVVQRNAIFNLLRIGVETKRQQGLLTPAEGMVPGSKAGPLAKAPEPGPAEVLLAPTSQEESQVEPEPPQFFGAAQVPVTASPIQPAAPGLKDEEFLRDVMGEARKPSSGAPLLNLGVVSQREN